MLKRSIAMLLRKYIILYRERLSDLFNNLIVFVFFFHINQYFFYCKKLNKEINFAFIF